MSSLSEMKVVRTKRLPKQVPAPRSRAPLYYSRSENILWLGIEGMFHMNLLEEFELDPDGDESLVSGAVESDKDGEPSIYWDNASDEEDLSLMSVRLHILEKVFGVKPWMS